MMKKVSKLLLILLTICLILSIFAGCGKKSDSGTAAGGGQKVTIRVAIPGAEERDVLIPEYDGRIKGTRDSAALINRKMPDINFEFVHTPNQDWVLNMEATITAGLTDIALYTNQTNAGEMYFDNDELFAMDNSISKADLYGKFTDAAMWYTNFKSLQHPGQSGYRGLPIAVYYFPFGYDKQLFDDWGVPYPSETPTYAELLDKARRTSGRNPKTGQMNFGASIGTSFNEFMMIGWDAIKPLSLNPMDIGNMQPSDYNYFGSSPEVLEYFRWIAAIVDLCPPGIPTGAGAERWFTEENDIVINLRMNNNSIFQRTWISDRKDLHERFIPINMPTGPKGGWSQTPMDIHLAVCRNTPHPVEAWQVLKTICTDKEIVDNISMAGFLFDNVPALKDVSGMKVMEMPQVKLGHANRAPTAFLTDDYWFWRQPGISTLGNMYTKAITPEQARTEFQTKIDEWISSVKLRLGK